MSLLILFNKSYSFDETFLNLERYNLSLLPADTKCAFICKQLNEMKLVISLILNYYG
jgi:hypothetical protein